MKLRAVHALATAACLAACSITSAEPSDTKRNANLPDATMRIEAKSVAVGLNSVTAKGGVYHLKTLEDFDGNFVSVPGGSTIGQGGARVAMINQNGVEVRLVAQNAGVTLTLGKSGVKLALVK